MSSVQHLREFIRERLTAAAQEIFTEVEKTIICYEEELDAQRRMMGVNLQQQIKLSRIGSELHRQSSDLQKPLIPTEKEMSVIPQVCPHKRRSSHDLEEAEPKQIKEEEVDSEQEKKEPDSLMVRHEQQPPEHLPTGQDQKDLCSSQEGEQLVQKQFVALIETSTLQEDDMSEEETRTEQLSLHISPVVESKDQEGSSSSVSESQSDTGTKKRSFKCDICGRRYTHQCNLKIHFRTHTGEGLFSCGTCGKSFSIMRNLNRHKRIHTGEKPFSCQICGKSFSRIDNLNEHKRIHTGEKPFSCQSCGKSFCQMGILNRHKTIHTGKKPFSCQSCEKSFYRRYNLIIHMKTHTGQGPF